MEQSIWVWRRCNWSTAIRRQALQGDLMKHVRDCSKNRGIIGSICEVLMDGILQYDRPEDKDIARQDLLQEYHGLRIRSRQYKDQITKCEARRRQISDEIRKIG